MKTRQEAREELTMKEQRVNYWEIFGVVPSTNELLYFAETNRQMTI